MGRKEEKKLGGRKNKSRPAVQTVQTSQNCRCRFCDSLTSPSLFFACFRIIDSRFKAYETCVMTDRRRINGPPGGTRPPVFASSLKPIPTAERPQRQRQPNELRKICTFLTLVKVEAYSVSPKNRPHPLCFRILLPRIRTLSFSLRCAGVTETLNTTLLIIEARMYSPRP